MNQQFPEIQLSQTITGPDINSLLATIEAITGLKLGYCIGNMIDTQIKSFYLSNGIKKQYISIGTLQHIDIIVRAWAMGRGLGNPLLSYPYS